MHSQDCWIYVLPIIDIKFYVGIIFYYIVLCWSYYTMVL